MKQIDDIVETLNPNNFLGRDALIGILHQIGRVASDKDLKGIERVHLTLRFVMKEKPRDESEVVYHLVEEGNSLFGVSEFACGTKSKDAVGYFEHEKVTCKACKRTKMYKQLKDGTYEVE